MENNLLAAACSSRAAFDTLDQLQATSTFSDIGVRVLEEIRTYYERDPEAISVDPEILKDTLVRKYQKKADVFVAVIDNFKGVSVPNVIETAIQHRKQFLKNELSAAFGADAKESVISELLEMYKACGTTQPDSCEDTAKGHHGKDISEVISRTTGAARIKLYPKAITDASSGGALRGHHILVFARPDCGKTTLAITMMYGFLKQELKVLYVSNEDPIDDILLRMYTRLTHLDRNKILSMPEKAASIAKARNIDNWYPYEMFPGTIPEIEELVRDIRPDVLVVDQACNIFYKARSEPEQLEKVERELRRIGKQYGLLTVSFTQAGDSAQNKLYLEMNDVHGSNTGMQASADLMVGLGVNNDYESRGKRMLSFPKNKLGPKQPMEVKFDWRLNNIS